ncbi:MAG: PIG-L family deacetylase, partial [Clostridia bacterium]|nr:PIG-L family deacetylase [Clostridia bacterium]
YVGDTLADTQEIYLAERELRAVTTVGDSAGESGARAALMAYKTKQRPFVFDTENCEGAVFYIPHQDDETLYFSQTITAAIDAFGAENVYTVLISDGAASSTRSFESISAPIDGIIDAAAAKLGRDISKEEAERASVQLFSQARTNEMTGALRAMGVVNIEICTYPDSKLPEYIHDIKLEMMRHRYNTDASGGRMMHFTFTPYYDIHADHRALGRALYELSMEMPDEFGSANFIVKNEIEYDDEFISEAGGCYGTYASFITTQQYAETIELAYEQYEVYSCDTEAIAEDIASIVSAQGCTIAEAAAQSTAVDTLRLAIGPQSVTTYFDNLRRHTSHRSTITTIHTPFDVNIYRYGEAEANE